MFRVLFRTILAIVIISLAVWMYFAGYFSANSMNYRNSYTSTLPAKNFYIFKGVQGPSGKTIIPQNTPPQLNQYSNGTNSRLAILLTDPSSNWLVLANGLKSIGIPFIVTNDYKIALRHKVIFVYPELSSNISFDEMRSLATFPLQGGTLIAQLVTNPKLFSTFGFQSATEVPINTRRLYFDTSSTVANNFINPEEKVINVGDGSRYTAAQFRYNKLSEKPIAIYESGNAAISQRNYSKGHAYAIGIDIGSLLSTGYNGWQDSGESGGLQRSVSDDYTNKYIPILDVLLQLIKNMYLQGQTDAVTLSPVPYGKSLAVIVTHDMCFSESIKGTPAYLDVELKHGIKATYFVQTKYITDEADFAFFIPKNFPLYQKLVDNGMELGSHSVSHPINFEDLPLGSGEEHYPDYKPYLLAIPGPQQYTVRGYIEATKTMGASILGELRVSRFLVQHFFPTQRVVSFRPGYLRFPLALPQAIFATKFLYTSSVTANDSLTHLPFKLFYNRDINQKNQSNVDVYQFPITVEDQLLPRLYDRLDSSLQVAKKIAHFGGLFVLLIHPTVDDSKVKFEDLFLTKIKALSTWYGTVAQYGDWWAARDQIEIDVLNEGKDIVTVKISAPKPISGLTLDIPGNFTYQSVLPSQIAVKQQEAKLIIEQNISGTVLLKFKVNPAKK
jgi:peptidoglycan/xylan/chitin deacetylase (PgdA/CDA1 family)